MQAARVICNDAGLTIAGNLLADTQPYATVLLNQGYRTLQEDLTANGVETFAKEAVLASVTPSAAPTDPGIFVFISYTGYNDGVTNHNSPALPPDMLGPLVLQERQSGSLQTFIPMFPATDGLVSRVKTIWLRDWEWRNDAIWMNGAIQTNDIRLRYNAFLPDLVLTPNPSQVMILRSDRAMAYQISKIFAEARGSPLAASFEKAYQTALERMVDPTARRKQRRNIRRQGMFNRSRMGSWGWQ
jgi:hypothetical protein